MFFSVNKNWHCQNVFNLNRKFSVQRSSYVFLTSNSLAKLDRNQFLYPWSFHYFHTIFWKEIIYLSNCRVRRNELKSSAISFDLSSILLVIISELLRYRSSIVIKYRIIVDCWICLWKVLWNKIFENNL